MAATTMSLTNVLSGAEESIKPVVKEFERTLLFTDVPCGAMKFRDTCGATDPAEEKDVSQNIISFCGSLERAFCFSDLQDVNETTVKSVDAESPEKDSPPAVEPADTESMSDDSAGKEDPHADKKAVDPASADKPTESTVPVSEAPKATPSEAKTEEKKPADDILPPANALQASKNKKKARKPQNALQAAKAAKKKDGKKKRGWGLFRRSNKKGSSKGTV